MKLSIIIVNYNVEYFLEQCLLSVEKALKTISGEIIVVDNNSVDGSVEMLKKKFPHISLIENKDNTGFSKANNQGIHIAKGEYVLLLNPDTVVEEDTFEKVVKFMDAHPNAGGLGVKMVDGKGQFLPESKRGLPTPSAAFYKIFGISKLFPKSKKFNRYHLGYLNENTTHEIEILSGAFMLMRKSVLDKVGLLDETFFMYGEDIDLSYRIIKGGYNNYYFPETKIIHYKGESTKKSSVNYVFVFYNAMIIFAEKHFSQNNARLFSFLIKLAIYFRASVAIFNRFVKSIAIPFIDFAAISGVLFVISHYYQQLAHKIFNIETIEYLLPFYALVWVVSTYLSGGYDKPLKPFKILKGIAIGTGVILMIYALLPKEIQFSRLMILIGASGALITTLALRLVYTLINVEKASLKSHRSTRFGIVGNIDECLRVLHLLTQTNHEVEFHSFISVNATNDSKFSGNIQQIQDILNAQKIDELIFCAKDISTQNIIETMCSVNTTDVDFKIAQPDSLYLIGSNSIDTSGDLYVLDVNTINTSSNVRSKRLFDVATSVGLLVLSPFIVLATKDKLHFLKAIVQVMVGKKTWVGYVKGYSYASIRLPKIKPCVFSLDVISKTDNQEIADKLNLIYAKDYKLSTDFKLLLKGIKSM